MRGFSANATHDILKEAMTIDERLERLTDRHEALTQSVELLVAEGKQTSEKIRHLAITAEQNEVRAGQMMENMNRLGRILEIHDAQIDQRTHRIERLEG
jgi:hypothetical protein